MLSIAGDKEERLPENLGQDFFPHQNERIPSISGSMTHQWHIIPDPPSFEDSRVAWQLLLVAAPGLFFSINFWSPSQRLRSENGELVRSRGEFPPWPKPRLVRKFLLKEMNSTSTICQHFPLDSCLTVFGCGRLCIAGRSWDLLQLVWPQGWIPVKWWGAEIAPPTNNDLCFHNRVFILHRMKAFVQRQVLHWASG